MNSTESYPTEVPMPNDNSLKSYSKQTHSLSLLAVTFNVEEHAARALQRVLLILMPSLSFRMISVDMVYGKITAINVFCVDVSSVCDKDDYFVDIVIYAVNLMMFLYRWGIFYL